MSKGLAFAQYWATGCELSPINSAAEGNVSGEGMLVGKESWCSSPASLVWNDAIIEKMASPL
jgi:hypothetical protein